MNEIRSERVWERISTGLMALAVGLMLAGMSLAVQQGWIEFSFLSNRRVIILIMSGMLGVILVLIGI